MLCYTKGKKSGQFPDHLGVLSSEFHLLRASMLVKRHGLEAVTNLAGTSDAKTFFTCFAREILMVGTMG